MADIRDTAQKTRSPMSAPAPAHQALRPYLAAGPAPQPPGTRPERKERPISFFELLDESNNHEPAEFVLSHRPDPANAERTRCGKPLLNETRANKAAGANLELMECVPCWVSEREQWRTAAEAAHELRDVLAQVSTLVLPHPGAFWTITLRTIHPGRWLVLYEGADATMAFSPDGTEWKDADEVHIGRRETCDKATLPLQEALDLARRLLDTSGPIYPLRDPLRN